MIKILTVFGTRPEAIKMAPIIQGLKEYPEQIISKVCVTAQHRQMLDQVLNLFNITPDYDLNVMQSNQTPIQVISAIFEQLDPIFLEEKPDWVLVQGDTTTVLATTLLAFHHHIKIGHVEAGLRTWNKHHPFPEEINRRVADVLSDLYFTPTETSRQNLLREGIDDLRIFVTGNTVIDALLQVARAPYDWMAGELSGIPRDRRIILVTAHRRESFGKPLRQICYALRDLAEQYDDVQIVYPVHHNPNVRREVFPLLENRPNISLLLPLDYYDMVHLMKASTLVLTDSGGLQEECPSLGIPVLVMRETTERPEAIEAGTARLVGANRKRIVSGVQSLLDNSKDYAQMAQGFNPYGDGHAAKRIIEKIIALV